MSVDPTAPVTGGAQTIAKLAIIYGKPPPDRPGSAAPPTASRKDSAGVIVCTAPDVCKTPSTPTPYQTKIDTGDAANPSPDVFFSTGAAVKFDTHTHRVDGDQPGVGLGVKSGTVGAPAWPMTASSTVFVNDQPLWRDGDKAWMNNANNPGELVHKIARIPIGRKKMRRPTTTAKRAS